MRRAPSAIGGSRWLRGCVATLLLTSAALLGAQSVAAAMTSLSSVVLSQTLPGMVAAPPGVRNGPINESNIGLVTGGSSSFEATQFGQLLASGNVNGYVRSWVHEPVNGDAVVICAFQFLDPGQAASFVSGAVPQQDGATSFAVPNVPGAQGYELHTSTSGVPVTEDAVAFDKSGTDILVVTVTESGDINSSDAASLASQQWADIPTPTNWDPVIRSIVGLGGILLSLAIILLARRRRYPAALTAQSPLGPRVTVRGQPVAVGGR